MLKKIPKDLNKFHLNLKFTYKKSKEKINFLDKIINIKEWEIITDRYCNETLRLKRACSEKNDLNTHVEDLIKEDILKILLWLHKREYPHNLVTEQDERALRITSSDDNNNKKVNGIPLLVTYNSAFKNLPHVIRKNLQLLYADEQVKKVF